MTKIVILMSLVCFVSNGLSSDKTHTSGDDVECFFICAQPPEDSLPKDPVKKVAVWICVINKANSTLRFPTGINNHVARGNSKLWLFVSNKMNPLGIAGALPQSKLGVVEISYGEAAFFKYEHSIWFDVNQINKIQVELEIPSGIGERYNCWSGKLTGTLLENSQETIDKITKRLEARD